MKRIYILLLFSLLPFVVFIILFALWAFIIMELNPQLWSEGQRISYIMCSVTVSAFAIGIVKSGDCS